MSEETTQDGGAPADFSAPADASADDIAELNALIDGDGGDGGDDAEPTPAPREKATPSDSAGEAEADKATADDDADETEDGDAAEESTETAKVEPAEIIDVAEIEKTVIPADMEAAGGDPAAYAEHVAEHVKAVFVERLVEVKTKLNEVRAEIETLDREEAARNEEGEVTSFAERRRQDRAAAEERRLVALEADLAQRGRAEMEQARERAFKDAADVRENQIRRDIVKACRTVSELTGYEQEMFEARRRGTVSSDVGLMRAICEHLRASGATKAGRPEPDAKAIRERQAADKARSVGRGRITTGTGGGGTGGTAGKRSTDSVGDAQAARLERIYKESYA